MGRFGQAAESGWEEVTGSRNVIAGTSPAKGAGLVYRSEAVRKLKLTVGTKAIAGPLKRSVCMPR